MYLYCRTIAGKQPVPSELQPSAALADGMGDGTENTRIYTVFHTAVTVYGTVGSPTINDLIIIA